MKVTLVQKFSLFFVAVAVVAGVSFVSNSSLAKPLESVADPAGEKGVEQPTIMHGVLPQQAEKYTPTDTSQLNADEQKCYNVSQAYSDWFSGIALNFYMSEAGATRCRALLWNKFESPNDTVHVYVPMNSPHYDDNLVCKALLEASLSRTAFVRVIHGEQEQTTPDHRLLKKLWIHQSPCAELLRHVYEN